MLITKRHLTSLGYLIELTVLQVRRHVEGARLECHFASFWEAMQVAGSLSGATTSKLHPSDMLIINAVEYNEFIVYNLFFF